MSQENYYKYKVFLKRILHKLKPRFSFHYVAYTTLFVFVIFSFINLATGATPNPGHPWIEVGDGVFIFTNGATDPLFPKTYTFPDANATVLTTNAAVTVGQGGTGQTSIAAGSIWVANSANTLSAITSVSGTKILTNTSGTISWEDSPSSMVYPGAGIPISTGSAWGTSITDNSANWNTAYGWGDHASGGYLLATGATTGATSQTQAFTNGIMSPTVLGGTSTTSGLTLQTTSGVGTTGADMHFLVGNNGDTEAMTILNNGNIGIGTNNPFWKLTVDGGLSVYDGTTEGISFNSDSIVWSNINGDNIFRFSYPSQDVFTFYNDGAEVAVFRDGRVGIGQTTPTARLHLKAGTATANTAPFKFTSGTNLTTPEAGAMEWDGTNLFITQTTGPTRKTLAYTTDITATAWDAIGDPTGNGSIAMGSTVQTMDWGTATTQNALTMIGGALTTGKLLSLTSDTLTSGTLLDITSAGTGGLTNQKGINVALSGTNASSGQTTYGGYFSNAHAGTTSTNVGLYASATGGTTANYAAQLNGDLSFTTGANRTISVLPGTTQSDLNLTVQAGNNTGMNSGGTLNLLGGNAGGLANGGSVYINGGISAEDSGNIYLGNTTGNVSVGSTTVTSLFNVGTAGQFQITSTGEVRLRTGSTTANTAPLKFTAGTNMTTPQAGAMEWDGTNLFITQTSGPTRKTLAYTSDITPQVYPGAGIPISTGSAWGTSITDNSTNWNTAYGWGDHASGGYLLATGATTGATSQAQAFTNGIMSPTVLGGTSTTSGLTLQTTSGVGTTGADMHFLVGNNGDTEAMTILNNGNILMGTTNSGNANLRNTGTVKFGSLIITENDTHIPLSSAFKTTKTISPSTFGTTSQQVDIGGTLMSDNNRNQYGITVGGAGTLTFQEQTSGNHPIIAGIHIDIPTITAGGATVSNTAGLYITGAMSATVTGGNYALYSNSGTNYFGGNVGIGDTNSNYGLSVKNKDVYFLGNDGNSSLYWDPVNGSLGITHVSYLGGSGNTTLNLANNVDNTDTNPEYGIYNGVDDSWYSSGSFSGSKNIIGTDNELNIGVLGAASGSTVNLYGTKNLVSYTATSDVASTRNLYGTYSSVTGDTAGTTTSYGAYLAASGSDTNYGLYSSSGLNYFSGNVGIGATTPTALLHLKAGTATAGTAPLKLTAGTNLTTPEAGAMEWDGTNLFITQTSGPTRKTLAYTTDITPQVYPGAGIALSTGSAWGTSITDNSANWNTAYGWGDHASGGYLLATGATTGATSQSQAFTNGIISPTVLGGTSTTSGLTLQTTSGVGTTGADMHFLVGNNGATEAMTILNNGNVGIGKTPTASFDVVGSSITSGSGLGGSIVLEAGNISPPWGGSGGKLTLSGGYRDASGYSSGGAVELIGGLGGDEFGGNVNITGGSSLGSGGGNVVINSGDGPYTGNIILGNLRGKVRIGSASTPTARFQLPAGTATASTAPLKFTSGTNLTVAEAGAMEWDGTNLFITQTSGPTRKTLAYTSDLTTGYVPYTGATTDVDLGSYRIKGGTIIATGTSATGMTPGVPNVVLYNYSGTTGRIFTYDGSSYYDLAIGDWNGGNPNIMLKVGGNVGISVGSPTARLQLPAGTATAGTAPLKLTAGTNLGTTEAGAIEYDGTHLYFTATNGGTRYQLDQQAGGVAWDEIGDPTGNGAIAMGSTVQTMDWGTATTQNALTMTGGALTTGKLLSLTSDTLTSGTLLDISSAGTGGLTNQRGLNIALSGTNSTAGQTTYGAYISNTHAGTTSTNVGLYLNASGGTTSNLGLNVDQGQTLLGGTTPTTGTLSKLNIVSTMANSGSTTAIAGIHGDYTFTNGGSASFVQIGNRFVFNNAPTTNANTMVGETIRVVDNTALANLVRGIDITANAGSNTAGTNTALRASGATFGVQGITSGYAGGVYAPAGLYGENTGATGGDVLRLYSSSMTSAPSFATFYHENSAFTGTGLLMDFATGTGSFTGNFADFQKNNTSLFKVTNTGIVSMGLSSTSSSTAVCSSLGNGVSPTSGVAYEIRDCSSSPVADYAEMYAVEQDVSYGDIVSVGEEMIDTYDTTDGNIDWNKVKGQITKLKKSSEPYQTNVIGIVSDNYGDFSSTGYNIKQEDNPMPVALSGRVPVRISSFSEPIKAGDFITTSGESGKAMRAQKAGSVIGKALEAWDPSKDKETITVFVEPGYYNGDDSATLLGLSLDDSKGADISYAKEVLDRLIEEKRNRDEKDYMVEVMGDRVIAGLEIITPQIVTNNLYVADEVEFNGLAYFNADVNFVKKIVFQGATEFKVPPLFSRDTAGFAIIKEGDQSVEIVFDNPYIETPIVTTSITFEKQETEIEELPDFFDEDIKYLVIEKDQSGFTILLNKIAPRDIRFSWVAFSVVNPNIFESVIDGLVIDKIEDEEEDLPPPSEPTPEPEPEPMPEPIPEDEGPLPIDELPEEEEVEDLPQAIDDIEEEIIEEEIIIDDTVEEEITEEEIVEEIIEEQVIEEKEEAIIEKQESPAPNENLE